jgi:hypothetical protein
VTTSGPTVISNHQIRQEDIGSRLNDFNINADLVDDPESALREYVVKLILPIFKWANGVVLGIVGVCLFVDVIMVAWGQGAYTRTVDRSVIMSLVGGTTIQLGILVVTIGGYLFPKRGSSISGQNTRRRSRRLPRSVDASKRA